MTTTMPVPTTISALARQMADWAAGHEQYMAEHLGERGFVRFPADECKTLRANLENATQGLQLIAEALEQDDIAGLEGLLRDAAAGMVEGVDGNR